MDSSDEDDDVSGSGIFIIHNTVEAGDEALLQTILFDRAGALALGLPFRPELLPQLLVLRDNQGCNPLHIAILKGQPRCLELLLRAGAKADSLCDGQTPLCMAACLALLPGREEAAMQAINLLLTRVKPTETDDGGRTALHWAAVCGLEAAVQPLVAAAVEAQAQRLREYEQDMEALKALGAEPPPPPEPLPALLDIQDADGHSPLHLAASFGHAAFIHTLAAHGQSKDLAALAKARTKDGHSALHLAALKGRAAAAQALLTAVPDPLATALLAQADRKGRKAADLALRAGHKALALALKEAQPGSWTFTLPAPAPAPAPSPVTLVLAPDECLLHLTAPEPMLRGAASPPPENVERLKVLTDPRGGILHSREFQQLGWETQGLPAATMSDILRCHDWSYVRSIANACKALDDSPQEVGHLDPDTAISHHSYLAALKAAGAVCAGVDRVMTGKAQNVFCAVRPPGHHAGPDGTVTNSNDPNGSHGFCLFSNVAIGAAYAMNVYRHQGIRRVALLDFDVHHGNGTEAVVANTVPSARKIPFSSPYSEGSQVFPTFKPWLDITDSENILFASVQGYGQRSAGVGSWFYPGSGETGDTRAPQEGGSREAAGPAAKEQEQAAHGAMAHAPEDPDGEFSASTSERGGAACSGPRIINVGVPGPGSRRLMWRRAWRDKILPAVFNFQPDIIIVSAGFDAHKKEDINLRFVGVTEQDYEWITTQIVELANRCCSGRVVSVLEGGYNLRGGLVSAFARSVAAHVRGLADGNTHCWDPADAQLERQWEAKRKEAAAAPPTAHDPAPAGAGAGAGAGTEAEPKALEPQVHETGTKAEAGSSAAAAAVAAAGGGGAERQRAEEAGGGSEEPLGKRRRRGAPVDYAALNAQLEAEAKGAS